MSSPEDKWWLIRAGEYVLGTLRGEDLRLFNRILEHDTEIQAQVERWERLLSPLNETTPDVKPEKHVWTQVIARVRQQDSLIAGEDKRALNETESSQQGLDSSNADGHTVPRQSAFWTRLWPAVAAVATTASVVLALLLFQREDLPTNVFPMNVDGMAVVLSDEDGKPYFLVETDYGNLRVRVTSLSPPALDDTEDFQLWQALPDRSAVRPVAVLPEEPGSTQIYDVSALIDGSDLFGVSIEPVGAATEAGPTGPVVAHGDYLRTHSAD